MSRFKRIRTALLISTSLIIMTGCTNNKVEDIGNEQEVSSSDIILEVDDTEKVESIESEDTSIEEIKTDTNEKVGEDTIVEKFIIYDGGVFKVCRTDKMEMNQKQRVAFAASQVQSYMDNSQENQNIATSITARIIKDMDEKSDLRAYLISVNAYNWDEPVLLQDKAIQNQKILSVIYNETAKTTEMNIEDFDELSKITNNPDRYIRNAIMTEYTNIAVELVCQDGLNKSGLTTSDLFIKQSVDRMNSSIQKVNELCEILDTKGNSKLKSNINLKNRCNVLNDALAKENYTQYLKLYCKHIVNLVTTDYWVEK